MSDVERTLALCRLAGWAVDDPGYGNVVLRSGPQAVEREIYQPKTREREFCPWLSLDDAAELADAIIKAQDGSNDILDEWSVGTQPTARWRQARGPRYRATIHYRTQPADIDDGYGEGSESVDGDSPALALFEALCAAMGLESPRVG